MVRCQNEDKLQTRYSWAEDIFENSTARHLSAKELLVVQKHVLSIQRLLAELILMSGEAGFGSLCGGWKVLRSALQFKNGCYDCYVCRIICCGSLLCSLSLGFSLSSGEMLSSELSVCRRWKVIFAYDIFSVQVSAKFLRNFLPLHALSSKWGTSKCLGTALYRQVIHV